MGETKIDMKSPLSEIDKAGNLAYGENDPLAPIYEGIKKNMNDLEARYAQPNWFKIAAGFAKPQLGGFIASLGSAAEAAGENFEQQRQLAIPLANMRTELAVKGQILARNKEVNDEIRAWYADPKNAGKLPPDKLAADWRGRAPDATGVKSLDTQVALQQKDRDQALQAIDAAVKNGKTVDPSLYIRAGIVPQNQKPDTNLNDVENQQNVDLTSVAKTLPNGARVNNVQSYLANLGIPIISGVRTQEEQDALKDHKDANGKWVTAKGLPVADVSKHTSGNAIDVDSSKLTDEQRGMLKASGFKQTDPKNDPNHWEMTSIVEPTQVTVGGVNMTPTQVQTFTSEAAKAREEPYAATMNDIVAQATNTRGHSFKDQETNLNTMNKLYNGVVYERDSKGHEILDENGKPKMKVDPNLQLGKAFEKLREPGIGSAALNSILQGVGAHTPWGDIVIKAPVAQFMTSLNLDRKGQERFIEFMRLMAEDRLLQSNLGLLRNEKEFNAAMSSITPEAFDPQQNINAYVNKRLAQTEYGQETHNSYHKWRQKHNMDPNVSNFWHSEEHNALRDKYSKRLEGSNSSLF